MILEELAGYVAREAKYESHNGRVYADVTADAGYESEENYTYFEQKDGQTCFMKPQNYGRSKTWKFKNSMNLREKGNTLC